MLLKRCLFLLIFSWSWTVFSLLCGTDIDSVEKMNKFRWWLWWCLHKIRGCIYDTGINSYWYSSRLHAVFPWKFDKSSYQYISWSATDDEAHALLASSLPAFIVISRNQTRTELTWRNPFNSYTGMKSRSGFKNRGRLIPVWLELILKLTRYHVNRLKTYRRTQDEVALVWARTGIM